MEWPVISSLRLDITGHSIGLGSTQGPRPAVMTWRQTQHSALPNSIGTSWASSVGTPAPTLLGSAACGVLYVAPSARIRGPAVVWAGLPGCLEWLT